MQTKNNFKIRKFLCYVWIFCVSLVAKAQQTSKTNTTGIETANHSTPCITKEEMNKIKDRVEQAKKRLEAQGKINSNRTSAMGAHQFRWPLAPAAHNYNFSYYSIINYIDLRSSLSAANDTSTTMDYNCGKRTYDTDDYNHDGTDIAIQPFDWTMMDNNDVDVVAAEGGFISDKEDGHFDRTCAWGSGNSSNYIAVTHYDGSTTFYIHLKNGRQTSKGQDQYVQAGEFLGKVGSSGNSTGPHLHFEVQDDLGNIRDPWNGGCNPVNSLWANQEPYYNKKILSIFTLSGPWVDATCDSVGSTHGYSGVVPYQNHFDPSTLVYFSSAVRDYTPNSTIRIKVLNPSGNALYDNTYSYNFYTPYLLVPPAIILAPSTTGTYQVQCIYNGITRAHYFTVGCPGSAVLAATRTSNYGKISGGVITSADSITPSARNVEYQAEDYIQLNDGFIASNGSEFLARIDNCTIGQTRESKNLNQKIDFDFQLAPNPANEFIKITWSENQVPEKISIINTEGKIVKSITSFSDTEFVFPIDDLSDGVYFVKVSFKSKIITKKAVVLRK